MPAGSGQDRTAAVTAQLERFAPGFGDLVLARHAATADDLSAYNPNCVGGDISAGAVTLWQLLKRPTVALEPWKTPAAGLYLASASTPPGPAVHGMAGWLAARSALRHTFGLPAPDLSPR